MRPKDLESILDELKGMAECELTLAEFYRTCAQIWEEDKEFWLTLERQENIHAQNIDRMAEIISKKHERFESYRAFNPAAMKTMISGIENNIRRLKSGEISKNNVLFIARDIEQSLIEAKYHEIVKTNDIEYQNLVKKIVSQTVVHKGMIDKKIATAKNAK